MSPSLYLFLHTCSFLFSHVSVLTAICSEVNSINLTELHKISHLHIEECPVLNYFETWKQNWFTSSPFIFFPLLPWKLKCQIRKLLKGLLYYFGWHEVSLLKIPFLHLVLSISKAFLQKRKDFSLHLDLLISVQWLCLLLMRVNYIFLLPFQYSHLSHLTHCSGFWSKVKHQDKSQSQNRGDNQ